MGSGKRNYRSMRANHRKWKKAEKPPEIEKKEVTKEEKEKFIELWKKIQNKQEK